MLQMGIHSLTDGLDSFPAVICRIKSSVFELGLVLKLDPKYYLQ